jgi:RNA-directed DNA polymerase
MTKKAYAGLGALSSAGLTWETIDWNQVKREVNRLQMRIAKATRDKRYGKVKALQWLLTHSFYAKLLAVKRITDSKGAKTPGVDQDVWQTPLRKLEGAQAIKRRGYKAKPLRRVYIAKKGVRNKRPLGIPTISDRAQQALHLMALEPVSETLADYNAYGFRPMRSAADAIEQCFNGLSQKSSARWCLEGDIEACFDKIDHNWLIANVTMDKAILKEWLKAGYVKDDALFATKAGTPQGGVISPCLLVSALSGLERRIKESVTQPDKVNVVAYADDFIITGASKDVLENKVKPVVADFLAQRGLNLSVTKTKLTHIDDGFDFLGFNLRKYKGKMLTMPSKESIKHFLAEIRKTIHGNVHAKTENLIRLLNPKILGWANYFRHSVAKRVYCFLSHRIFKLIQWWIKRRHPTKSATWKFRRYYRRKGMQKWVFHAKASDSRGKAILLDLINPASVKIVRHIKVKGAATPYDPAFRDYFAKRRERLNKRGRMERTAKLKPLNYQWVCPMPGR